ncbi:hypothetical protein H7J06_28520 [Mycobacterium hodleri]|uniref:hypothetical protein n=1 Tax=Mycolicibacterium hodleri TaxID=49897 RepID=UPI0021F37475|nr:hypothetical protein [Mycolicibacterium hodleri]MCV7136919.1 hypothetical protein [Mycolicibacterium hodleri]
MAFTLTYSDGQETDYDDDTAWEVENGVLKMGRRDGEWSVYVSPSHWAVLEVGGQRGKDDETDAKADARADDETDDADAGADDEDRDKPDKQD